MVNAFFKIMFLAILVLNSYGMFVSAIPEVKARKLAPTYAVEVTEIKKIKVISPKISKKCDSVTECTCQPGFYAECREKKCVCIPY